MTRRRRHTRPSPSTQLGLALVDPGSRTTTLGRERDRLVREIGRRRRELERAEQKILEATTRMHSAAGPIVERQRALGQEIHALFAELLAPGRMGKRKRAKVREVLATLVETGLIGPAPSDDEVLGDEQDVHGGGFDDAPFGPGPEGGPGETTVPSANKPPDGRGHGTLRTLFKRLVVALHPDRTQNENEKARRTAAMKDVTRAYEAGDLARLIELGALFSSGPPAAAHLREPALEAGRLERTVAELQVQLRNVLDDLRHVRRSEEFRAAKDLERLERAGGDPMAVLLAEEQARLADLLVTRDFVAAFHAGKMTLEAFLDGPSFPLGAAGVETEALAQLFDELLSELDSVAPEPRRGHRGQRSDPIPC